MKVPDLQISSILYLNKGKFELIRHFGLLQIRISSDSFVVPRHSNLSGLESILYLIDYQVTVRQAILGPVIVSLFTRVASVERYLFLLLIQARLVQQNRHELRTDWPNRTQMNSGQTGPTEYT